MSDLPPGHKFPAGKTQVTQAAMGILQADGHMAAEFLSRHVAGDGGNPAPPQRAQNDAALESGGPLHSIYHTRSGRELWVFTDANRVQTTILLPEDQTG